MSAFTPTGGNVLGSFSTTISGVTTPTITNITSTGSEQLYALPTGTREFSIQGRGLTQILLAYMPGALDYMTIQRGCIYQRADLDASAIVILYFQVADSGQVIEIESWV